MIFMIVIVALLCLYHSNAKRLNGQRQELRASLEKQLEKQCDVYDRKIAALNTALNLIGNSAKWNRTFAVGIAGRNQKCALSEGFRARGRGWASVACAANAKEECVCGGIKKGDAIITTVDIPPTSAKKDAEEKEWNDGDGRKLWLRNFYAQKAEEEDLDESERKYKSRIATAKVVEKISS
ncbi:MAG: hypothetical protein JRE24_01740 [Deltaproteobacteria bacterium]|nr:hypothetical protein [Deltaproteobacteria bacterium]